MTNRSLAETATVRIRVSDRAIASLHSAEVLTGPDAKAANSFEQPDGVRAQPLAEVRIADGGVDLVLPALSVAAATFELGS